MTLEAPVQKKIMELIEERMYNVGDIFIMRCHTGHAFKNQHAIIKLAPKGTPDLMVLFKKKAYGFECKRPKGGRLGADQIRVRKIFKKIGIEYHTVRSVSQVKKILGIK